MVNKIWGGFIIAGILFCLFTGKVELLNQVILDSTKESFDMVLKIFPVMALWLGIMNIATISGLLKKLSNQLSKVLKRLFPDIPEGHEAFSYIASNIVVNLFGLGNAATPFGLKAMKSLQTLNRKKDTASRSMITFLVLNTSGMTIIPTTIISLRMLHGSVQPTEIVFPCILATLAATIAGLTLDRLLARRHRYDNPSL